MFHGSIRFRYATTYSTVNHASVHACSERPLFFGFRGSRFGRRTFGPRFRNESPKNSGVCRWWLSGRLCCAALAAGIGRLGLVAPALKSSSRSRCENNPPEFRPYCPAMKLRRGRNTDNFCTPALSGLGSGATNPKSRRERVRLLVSTPCASWSAIASRS